MRYNKTSWMTELDKKMNRQHRNVILFLDNATCLSTLRLRNVKLAFFPPNTTFAKQPMDQGIIQAFKLQYRKRLVQHLLSALPSDMTVANVENRKISILDAVTWINTSWANVNKETIVKSFKKCGFPVVSDPVLSDAVASDLVENEQLLHDLTNVLSHSEWQAYINFDSTLSVTEQN